MESEGKREQEINREEERKKNKYGVRERDIGRLRENV